MSKIICMGWNYRPHINEMHAPLPEEPTVFLKPTTCLIADGEDIQAPEGVTNIQHEVELALVFGRTGRDIPVSDAMSYVSHVAVFNDVTARDMQTEDRRTGNPWSIAKGMDTFGPMSRPIPVEEAGDLGNLELELSVNGEVRQKGNTADMIFTIPELISFASRFMTIEAGDIMATGTPDGISEIRPGDVVVCRIENVGTLTNKVVSPRTVCSWRK